MDSPPEYLIVSEIAEQLRVNRASVYRWIDDGLLPAVKVGPQLLRVKRSDLDAFLAGQQPAAS